MAGNSKPRKKSGKGIRRKSQHIEAVLRRCVSKFHIIGDMNHVPTAFHFGDMSLHLKGMDLRIGLEHFVEFLNEERKTWTFLVIHYFSIGDAIEVVPAHIEIEDTTMVEMGRNGEIYLKQIREQVYAADDRLSDDNLEFYGYYITHGKDLPIQSIEDQLTDSFMIITKDLAAVRPSVTQLTKEGVIKSLEHDKFRLHYTENAMSSDMVEV